MSVKNNELLEKLLELYREDKINFKLFDNLEYKRPLKDDTEQCETIVRTLSKYFTENEVYTIISEHSKNYEYWRDLPEDQRKNLIKENFGKTPKPYREAFDNDSDYYDALTEWQQSEHEEKPKNEILESKTKDNNEKIGNLEATIKTNAEITAKTAKKSTKESKIEVFFKEVGDTILGTHSLFTMADTGEFFVYNKGVYENRDAERFLRYEIRRIYAELYAEKLRDLIPNFSSEPELPTPSMKFIYETLGYLRDLTFVSRQDIDRDWINFNYINFKNGLFNLDTWKLEPHDPKIKSITQIPVSYDPEAICPMIEKYFVDCELTDEDIKLLKEYAGYCLIPSVRLQKALLLYGSGSNGKSVFINLLKTIMGPKACSNETLQDLEEKPYRVANLYGKLLNAFPDLKDKALQSNEIFNILTGGDGICTGERKYENTFDFIPTVKLLFSANRPPAAYSDNYAYYRRWLTVEFPHTFSKDEIDVHLINKLTTEEEKSGFLNLMLKGLHQILQIGKFSKNQTVEDTTRIYRFQSDPIAVFVETCCRDCKTDELPMHKNRVYKVFTVWCEKNNIKPAKSSEFKKRMAKLGRPYKRTTIRERDEKGELSDPIHLDYYEDTVAALLDYAGISIEAEVV